MAAYWKVVPRDGRTMVAGSVSLKYPEWKCIKKNYPLIIYSHSVNDRFLMFDFISINSTHVMSTLFYQFEL